MCKRDKKQSENLRAISIRTFTYFALHFPNWTLNAQYLNILIYDGAHKIHIRNKSREHLSINRWLLWYHRQIDWLDDIAFLWLARQKGEMALRVNSFITGIQYTSIHADVDEIFQILEIKTHLSRPCTSEIAMRVFQCGTQTHAHFHIPMQVSKNCSLCIRMRARSSSIIHQSK